MQLNPLQRDALCELLNIGIGMAANVLSQMVSETVLLSVPEVDLVAPQDVVQTYATHHQLCTIEQTFTGSITTQALLMFPEENSLELVRMMVGNEMPLNELTEMEQDALAEIGNIILNAVISTLSNSLEINFDSTLPVVRLLKPHQILVDVQSRDQRVLSLTIDF